jgi:hypothetical protein
VTTAQALDGSGKLLPVVDATEPTYILLLRDDEPPLPGDAIMETWSEYFGEMRKYRIRIVTADTPGALRLGPIEVGGTA